MRLLIPACLLLILAGCGSDREMADKDRQILDLTRRLEEQEANVATFNQLCLLQKGLIIKMILKYRDPALAGFSKEKLNEWAKSGKGFTDRTKYCDYEVGQLKAILDLLNAAR